MQGWGYLAFTNLSKGCDQRVYQEEQLIYLFLYVDQMNWHANIMMIIYINYVIWSEIG